MAFDLFAEFEKMCEEEKVEAAKKAAESQPPKAENHAEYSPEPEDKTIPEPEKKTPESEKKTPESGELSENKEGE